MDVWWRDAMFGLMVALVIIGVYHVIVAFTGMG